MDMHQSTGAPPRNLAMFLSGLRGKYEGQGSTSALELAETILQPP
ncbi:hypothetical protein WJX84_006577, partial [Apatococcus fuscideae]